MILGENTVKIGDIWEVNGFKFLIIGFHKPNRYGLVDANVFCLDPGWVYLDRIGFITEGVVYTLLARV